MQDQSTEIAWAAGLFEGEGSIAFTTKTGVQVVLGMCDADVVQHWSAIFGCGSIYFEPAGKKYQKDFHRWVVSDKHDVERVLKALLPWLGQRRADRARAALQRLAANPGRNSAKTHCKHGHEFTPENTYLGGKDRTWRWCRACLKARRKDRLAVSPA